jgi:hypothetical protein
MPDPARSTGILEFRVGQRASLPGVRLRYATIVAGRPVLDRQTPSPAQLPGGADGPAGSVTTGMGARPDAGGSSAVSWASSLSWRQRAVSTGQRLSRTANRIRRPWRVMHRPARSDDNVPVLPWQQLCAGVLIIRPASVPVRPAVGSGVHTAGLCWLPARCSSSVTTADGLAWFARLGPDPSRSRTVTTNEAAKAAARRGRSAIAALLSAQRVRCCLLRAGHARPRLAERGHSVIAWERQRALAGGDCWSPRPGGTLGEAAALRTIQQRQPAKDARPVRKGGLSNQSGDRPARRGKRAHSASETCRPDLCPGR